MSRGDHKSQITNLKSPSRARAFLRRRFSKEETLGLYLTVGFMASALVVILFGMLADEVFEITGPGPLDRRITLAARDLHSTSGDAIARAVTSLGDARFLVPACLVTVVLLYARKHPVSGLLFAGSVVGGWLLETLLKIVFHRARPDLWPALVAERTPSFPSGHAAMTTVFFGGVAAIVLHMSRKSLYRTAAVAAAAVVVASVCFTRVYLGVHWTTDVAGGVLVGLFWVVVCATGTEYFARRR